jgi:anti-sigma-K factor RskA
MNDELRRHDEGENVGAYALGALPELEAQVFERHLMGCEECQEELRRLNEAVEALPRSVTPHEAPTSLKTSVMEVVNAEAAGRNAVRDPARWRPSFRLPRLAPAAAWAAAAVLIVGVLAGYGISELAGDDDGGRTLQAQVDMKRLPEGSASLSVEDEESVLRVEGMPDPGAERVYQVWVQHDGEVVPASIFNVDSNGAGSAAVPQPLEEGDAVMVTRERRGGAEAPTEAPVLRVDV